MKSWQNLAALLAFFTVATPIGLNSCAIGPPEPVFTVHQRPADLKRAYVDGRLGVLWPSFGTKHLIAAYRVLHGVKFTQEELATVFAQPVLPLTSGNAMNEWRKVRIAQNVPDPNAYLSTYKAITQANEYSYFENCPETAILNAVSTYNARAKTWGAGTPNLNEWFTGARSSVFKLPWRQNFYPTEAIACRQ